MQLNKVYIKCERNVETEENDIFLKDIGSVFCHDKNLCTKLKCIKVHSFKYGESKRCVISTLKLVELMENVCPNILVEVIGETDVLIEQVDMKKRKGMSQILKIIMVCLISFFGTAFSIMVYHNDSGINDVFHTIYNLTMQEENSALSILEISYSIGVALGIIIFFNHVGGRRITKEPTPIEVAMRIYEHDVDITLIETADREKLEEDVE